MDNQILEASIRPDQIAIYYPVYATGARTDKQINAEKNLQCNDHHGEMSLKAQRKVKKAVAWLLAVTDKKAIYSRKQGKKYHMKIGFITLTLSAPQMHDDNTIKSKLLHQFFVEARKRWGVKHYIWKAEKEKNGRIHFHITTDQFIPWRELRDVWNRLQNKLGYVDHYAASHGHHDPNSTDVHSVRKIKNLAAYLAKYLAKNEKNNTKVVKETSFSYDHVVDNGDSKMIMSEPKEKLKKRVTGRLWGVSQSLSKCKSLTIDCVGNIADEIDNMVKTRKLWCKNFENYTIIKCEIKDIFSLASGNVGALFRKHILMLKSSFNSQLQLI